MSVGYPGGSNTYVPTLELSGNLMVSFARNVKKYPVNRYCRVTPVKKDRGAYLRFDPLSLARFPNVTNANVWSPGTLRPTYSDGTLGFEQKTFQTKRYNFGKLLDQRAIDLANWPILKMHSEALAQDAMTHRAYTVANKLFDTTQYAGSHVVTASSLAGGFLDGGTTSDARIKKAFDGCAGLIQKDSMGKVRWGELSVLINHNTAKTWSQSREIREYVMQQSDALKNITLDESNYNAAYGLPSKLYNFNLVIEDLYYNPYNQGDTAAVGTPIVPDNKAVVFFSGGEQEQPEGAPSFSTCHVFAYEEMTIETWDDPRNRITELDVVMDYDTQIVAPVTGVVLTNLFS